MANSLYALSPRRGDNPLPPPQNFKAPEGGTKPKGEIVAHYKTHLLQPLGPACAIETPLSLCGNH
jgi:hypothetical protein